MPSSIYRKLISAIARDWRTRFPWVSQCTDTICPALPKASTFYAGVASVCGKHVFVNFQHAAKPWEVGRVTINLVISSRRGLPRAWLSALPADLSATPDGVYRTSMFLGGRDCWWHLHKPSEYDRLQALEFTTPWFASDYADEARVLLEAIQDIDTRLEDCFRLLGVPAVQK